MASTFCVAETHPNAQDTAGCGSVATPCLTIQYAVDESLPGEQILVAAGTYTGVNAYASKSQVLYISKTLDLRGGYTHTNWAMPDPDMYPTVIDAEDQGRGHGAVQQDHEQYGQHVRFWLWLRRGNCVMERQPDVRGQPDPE